MTKNWKPSSPWLRRKAKQGFKGYPIATIAFYGPTDTLATKIVVSIVRDEGHEPDPLERWFSDDTDVRNNPAVGEKVVALLKEHAPKSVIVTDGLIGCPHEEGIDYPEYCDRSTDKTGRKQPSFNTIHFTDSIDHALQAASDIFCPHISRPLPLRKRVSFSTVLIPATFLR